MSKALLGSKRRKMKKKNKSHIQTRKEWNSNMNKEKQQKSSLTQDVRGQLHCKGARFMLFFRQNGMEWNELV